MLTTLQGSCSQPYQLDQRARGRHQRRMRAEVWPSRPYRLTARQLARRDRRQIRPCPRRHECLPQSQRPLLQQAHDHGRVRRRSDLQLELPEGCQCLRTSTIIAHSRLVFSALSLTHCNGTAMLFFLCFNEILQRLAVWRMLWRVEST